MEINIRGEVKITYINSFGNNLKWPSNKAEENELNKLKGEAKCTKTLIDSSQKMATHAFMERLLKQYNINYKIEDGCFSVPGVKIKPVPKFYQMWDVYDEHTLLFPGKMEITGRLTYRHEIHDGLRRQLQQLEKSSGIYNIYKCMLAIGFINDIGLYICKFLI